MLWNRIYQFFFVSADAVIAEKLYWQVLYQSRTPLLFQNYGLEDTVDGRFDSVILHIFPLLGWLSKNNHSQISDHIVNIMIKDMDRSLRQSGVGDPSMARKMRKIGEAYMGRITAYQSALDGEMKDQAAIEDVLFRNLYRSDDSKKIYLSDMHHYFLALISAYDRFSLDNAIFDVTPLLKPNHGRQG